MLLNCYVLFLTALVGRMGSAPPEHFHNDGVNRVPLSSWTSTCGKLYFMKMFSVLYCFSFRKSLSVFIGHLFSARVETEKWRMCVLINTNSSNNIQWNADVYNVGYEISHWQCDDNDDDLFLITHFVTVWCKNKPSLMKAAHLSWNTLCDTVIRHSSSLHQVSAVQCSLYLWC